MGQKIYHVDLSLCERVGLEDIVKRRKSSSEATKRGLILLAADRSGPQQWTDNQIVSEYKVSVRTVERLRERFVLHGLEIALSGLPRPNVDKIKFDGVVESHLVSLRCSNPPEGRSSWTLQLLELYNVFEPQRARAILNKLEFVYTPKHGSWLNIAECELSVLSRQALDARFKSQEK